MSAHPTHRAFLRSWRPLGALAVLLAGAGVAVATGTPTSSPLVWGGTVTDDAGKPYDNAVAVSVAFYAGQNATTPVCESQTVNAEAKTGRFSVVLPDACAKAVHDSPDLWSETVVGPSKTKLPRVKVAAVPYALEAAVAGVAEKAGGALAGEISGLSGKVSGAEGKIAQLELEVAALKGGGSGGSAGSAGPGGPVMVDSNGTVVGTFTTLTYGSNTYSVLTTKTGWNVWLSPETSPLRFGPKGGAVFKSADCSGTPYFLRDSVSFVGRNTAMIFSDGTAWFRFKPSVVDPNLPEETKVTIMSARQFSGTCTKLTLGDSYVFEGVSIPLLESGMPSASMGPWYWSKP